MSITLHNIDEEYYNIVADIVKQFKFTTHKDCVYATKVGNFYLKRNKKSISVWYSIST
jgi:hypothetical protein